jgi:hypothetical protein
MCARFSRYREGNYRIAERIGRELSGELGSCSLTNPRRFLELVLSHRQRLQSGQTAIPQVLYSHRTMQCISDMRSEMCLGEGL